MESSKTTRRARRTFSAEFKADAVKLCQSGDRSIAEVARDLDLTPTALRSWVRNAPKSTSKNGAPPLTSAEREELHRLRRENRTLLMERDILKKATLFFAKVNK